MRRLTVCVCLLIFAGSAASDEPKGPLTPEQFLQQWARTLTAGKVETMLAFYEDSEHVIAIESNGRVRKGRRGIREMYEEAFAEVVFEAVALTSIEVREDGGIAWATCRFKADTRVKANNTPWTLEVHGSFVLCRTGETCKIVLEHFSPIAGIPRVRRRM